MRLSNLRADIEAWAAQATCIHGFHTITHYSPNFIACGQRDDRQISVCALLMSSGATSLIGPLNTLWGYAGREKWITCSPFQEVKTMKAASVKPEQIQLAILSLLEKVRKSCGVSGLLLT